MDLGIKGKRALVCGASKGLGRACANALAEAGVDLVINSRTEEQLAQAAREIAETYGVSVETVAGDISDDDVRKQAVATAGPVDILVNNAGGPPTGDFRDWDEDVWLKALKSNMLTQIFLIRETVDGMIERKFGRILNITSGAVKAPLAPLGLSNGARTGLTGFVAGLARDVAQHNVTVNNILPGPFETDRLEVTLAGMAKKQGISLEEARERRRSGNPSKRFGRPEEFGAAAAFLASDKAGFITGQNLLLDGGAFPGTL
ncbi:SDR family oxidoreductase [Roseibium sp. SCP14]|uniref:SDR family oxidoreductase n=1 Tax=Roseibium sp. SCP14 TaxID=3141375 RepID=UPI003335249C